MELEQGHYFRRYRAHGQKNKQKGLYLPFQYYSKADLIAAQEELQAGEIKLGIQFIDISFGRLLEYLAITMERVRLGKKITKEDQDRQSVKIPDKYSETALDILKHVLPEMKKGYLAEAQYLAARFFVASACDDANIEVDEEYRDYRYRFSP